MLWLRVCKELHESSSNLKNEMGLTLIQAEQRLPLAPKLMKYILTPKKSPQIYVGASKYIGGNISEEIVLVKEDVGGKGQVELSLHHPWSLLRHPLILNQHQSQYIRMLRSSIRNHTCPLPAQLSFPHVSHNIFERKRTAFTTVPN